MERQITRRIIGIVVLVVLMVALAPLLFKGAKQRVTEPNMVTEISTPPAAPVLQKVDISSNKTVQKVVTMAEPKVKKPPIVTAKPITVKAKPEVARWTIQVASFSHKSNAEKLVAQLKRDGFAAYSKNFLEKRLVSYRVYVKPNKRWTNSLKALVTLRKKFKINGMLIRE